MDLTHLLARGPLPSDRALTLIHPLAVTTHELHLRGRTAGLTDPRRLRLVDGELVADPLPPGHDDSSLDDVRGLGAVLYVLLTGHWPLVPGAAGLRPAPRRPGGGVVPPEVLRPDVALEVSELVMAALGADQDRSAARICTAGAVARLVEELQTDWTVDLLPPVDGTGSDRTWSFEPAPARTATDRGTRRKLSVGLSGLAAAAVLTLGLVGTQAASAFGLLPTSGPPPIVVSGSAPAAVIVPPTPVAARTPGALPAVPAARAEPAPVARAVPSPVARVSTQRPKARDEDDDDARDKAEERRQQKERNSDRGSDRDSDSGSDGDD